MTRFLAWLLDTRHAERMSILGAALYLLLRILL